NVGEYPGCGRECGGRASGKIGPRRQHALLGGQRRNDYQPVASIESRLRSSARSRADCSRSGDVEHPCRQQRGASEKRRGAVCAREGPARVAVTSLKRSPIISELPTLAESGFPDFEAISWFGLLAPAGTPAAVVSKVHADIVQIAVQADVRERIAQLGLEVSLNSPEEFAVVIKSDTAK